MRKETRGVDASWNQKGREDSQPQLKKAKANVKPYPTTRRGINKISNFSPVLIKDTQILKKLRVNPESGKGSKVKFLFFVQKQGRKIEMTAMVEKYTKQGRLDLLHFRNTLHGSIHDIIWKRHIKRVYGKFCIETLHERHNGIQRLVVCLSEYLQERSHPLVSNITRQCWSYLVKW